MSKQTCYCCDKPASGQGDHVPPKKLFPKGSFATKYPIIVPSCSAHNESLSNADEYLKFVLASSSERVPSDVQQSTVRGLVRLLKKKSSTIGRYGLELEGANVRLDGSAPIDHDLLNKSIEKIARGLYFYHSQQMRKLLGTLVVFPLFLGVSPFATREEREQILRIARFTQLDMQEREMIAVHPGIFSYQVIESSKIVVVNMVFYGNKIVSVMGETT